VVAEAAGSYVDEDLARTRLGYEHVAYLQNRRVARLFHIKRSHTRELYSWERIPPMWG